ncbi:restriction endonuclease subunit S [Plantactinospora sp. B6F1]|uniref:restriction endonuclease subunit S n=1 Tax=Plantactinospora sp. B6F1 TaxID=3158971 RepID=UPI0032D91F27
MNDLPSGWVWATLDELQASEPRAITDGPFGSNLTSAHYTDEGARVIRLQNIGDGQFVNERAYISLDHYEKLRVHNVRQGDLLVASLGQELPRVCLAPTLDGPAIVKADCIRVRLHSGVVAKWVVYAMMAPTTRRYAANRIRGVGRPRLGLGEIRKVPIPVPPLAEQRRIVATLEDHLSVVDSGIAQLSALTGRINRFRDQVMLAASTGQLSLGPDRVTASRPAPAGVDDGELPPIPEAWKWMRLREIADVVGGVTKDNKRQSDPSFVEVPYLRVANVQRAYLDLTEVAHIRVSPQKAEQLRLRQGDVLLNEGGDRDKLGRGWIWENQVPGCIHQNHVFRARISGGVLHPKLLAWHANGFGRRWFEVNGLQSVNLASISLRKMKEFPVPVPPLVEQSYLVELAEKYLSLLDGMEKAIESARLKADGLRTALLATAFAGRLVPQDPNDEPASELLARIRAERAAVPPKQRAARGRRTQKDKPAPPTRVIGRDYQQGELPL